jgi:hypothetical protein
MPTAVRKRNKLGMREAQGGELTIEIIQHVPIPVARVYGNGVGGGSIGGAERRKSARRQSF